jgi:hypothetical protein
MTKLIKKYNAAQFLTDIKSVREVMVWVQETGTYLQVKKRDVRKRAEEGTIKYRMTDEIFKVKRITMVIL